ncbi:hypothetical protein UPYG_G00274560 [Umbra pygmaea]|uniref:SEFIR domain-containing protein n=1 Tax=Umbra pygmaea TaxID=75934 RepID=A0ABD0W6D9_UMBPY
MDLFLKVGLLLSLFSTLSCLQILRGPALNCTQNGLLCKADITNCFVKDWFIHQSYTPSDPVGLEVNVDTREDELGNLQPVVVARWKAKDDGSIRFLKGTMLKVLMEATNQDICVQYEFLNTLKMQNPANEMWSFSSECVVVEPGFSYVVYVSNLPKPNLHHSSDNVFKPVSVPGCKDPKMQVTQVCLETGILWTPNTTLERSAGQQGRVLLTANFTTDQFAPKYTVSLLCSNHRHGQEIHRGNKTSLSVQFDLDEWPRTCCYFDVEIQPFFDRCSNDCIRRKKTFNICGASPTVIHPDNLCGVSSHFYVLVAVSTFLTICGLVCCLIYKLRKTPEKVPAEAPPPAAGSPPFSPPRDPPRVLVIYSQDHPLYRKMVLKLCAFLQAKCGTEVVLDLLDTTWLAAVGRLPWLEWQRQQVKRSSDKILVLCSRGVQAKWQAMCGQGRVTLREDLCSPIDDMLTPALNLFLPDMQQAAAMGKYMVAYFEDVSSESDVPSVFDIAVKYRLMKHFEEICFRILDQEKFSPGKICHIEGIGPDEYFLCQPGRELRDAIEAFQAFQLENPDWFAQECVDIEAEEEVVAVTEYDPLLEEPASVIIECVPKPREGPPIYVNDVKIQESTRRVQVLTAEVNPDGEGRSVRELLPRVNSDCPQVSPLYPAIQTPPGVLISDLYPHGWKRDACGLSDLLLSEPPLVRENCLHLEDRMGTADSCPVENEETEEEKHVPSSCQPSADTLKQLMSLQLALSGFSAFPDAVSTQHGYQSQQPVENNLPVPVKISQSQLTSRPNRKTYFVSEENGYQSQPVDQSLPIETDQSQLSFTSIQVTPPSSVGKQIQYLCPQPDVSSSQPVEMEEDAEMESPEKRPVSGSDQGYMSRTSIQDSPIEENTEDPLVGLARLQQTLYHNGS